MKRVATSPAFILLLVPRAETATHSCARVRSSLEPSVFPAENVGCSPSTSLEMTTATKPYGDSDTIHRLRQPVVFLDNNIHSTPRNFITVGAQNFSPVKQGNNYVTTAFTKKKEEREDRNEILSEALYHYGAGRDPCTKRNKTRQKRLATPSKLTEVTHGPIARVSNTSREDPLSYRDFTIFSIFFFFSKPAISMLERVNAFIF